MHFSSCYRCDWTYKKTVQFFIFICLEIYRERKLTEILFIFVDFNNVLGSYNEGFSGHTHAKNLTVHYLHKYMCTPTQVFILDTEHTLFGPWDSECDQNAGDILKEVDSQTFTM